MKYLFSTSRLTLISGGWSVNLTLPDCVRVARFYRELGFAPNQRLGESKDRSFESDDLMFWDVRPGLCRDVVPLAHQSF
jgi:hypothetical protein